MLPSAPCGVWGLFPSRRRGGAAPGAVLPTTASVATHSRGHWAEGLQLLQMVPPVSSQDLALRRQGLSEMWCFLFPQENFKLIKGKQFPP